ncbi:MAG: hypothetical protein UHE86_06585 [Acutalibacteraceae bacterium]|nr:hypothetical protein [Acutalibacteraceae bacterium]
MNRTNITINAGGQPLLQSTAITVGTETVDIAIDFRRIQPMGYFTVSLSDLIPTGTTGTLPITLTLNGTTRNLTLPNGSSATVGDLEGISVFLVYNDIFRGRLFLMSRTTV